MEPAVQSDLLSQLQSMLVQAQRGELAIGDVALEPQTQRLRQLVSKPLADADLLWAAECAQLLARLLELKMGRQLEPVEQPQEEPEEDPGSRLAEYRLFKAAADLLISDPGAGPRAFLRVLGMPVEPQTSLELTPERLALALGELISRLPEPQTLEVAAPRYTVAAKIEELRSLLRRRPELWFDELFTGAVDRLEAVTLFVALLELLRRGEVSCSQDTPQDRIRVGSHGAA